MNKLLGACHGLLKAIVMISLCVGIYACAGAGAKGDGGSMAEAEHAAKSVNDEEVKSALNPASGDNNSQKAASHELLSSNSDVKTGLNSQLNAQNPSMTADYVIGPEDMLEIDVYEVSELNKTVRVSSSGFIKLPLTGVMKVSGLTIPELEEEISKKLERYLQDPLVSIFIREYRSQSITVLGAVKKPQAYVVTRQKTLIDMISVSGGLTGEAADICFIRRGGETIIINVRELLIGGEISLNVPVYSGDIIHFPVGGVVFVDGAVNSPGSFKMKGKMTVTQVIAMSRGFRPEAIRGKVRVYRDSGKGNREIIDVDYDAILEKKEEDFILKDKDVVIVPKSVAKSLWYGFVESLSGSTSLGKISLGAGF